MSNLKSHNSAQVTYKKSVPKNVSAVYNNINCNFKANDKLYNHTGLAQSNPISKPKIPSIKHLNQIPNQRKDKTLNVFHPKNNQQSSNKQTKSKSCQNSQQKIAHKNTLKTLHTGSSTQRNPHHAIGKRSKKTGKIDFQYIGTQTKTSREKSKSFINHQAYFYEANHTEKLNEVRWQSKELSGNKKKASMFNDRQKSTEKIRGQVDQQTKWDETLIPYKWKQVIEKHSHLLARYEFEEIKEYKNIYYVGQKVQKRDKERRLYQGENRKQLFECDNLFDNEENEYIYEMHDHIGYRYEILGRLGKGSYGQVLRVFDHKKKETVALKIVRNRTKFNQQAFIEIQILTHIKQRDSEHKSNIVKIKDFIIFRKHVCIVFELLSENLYQLIARNNFSGLTVDLIRRFAIQILTGLHFLRTESIIHCDLKPENILLKQFNKSGIKIIDFGSSCFLNQTKYTYIQSRYYRAPEITLGIKYSHQIDMWSTGCIIAELFTGIPLFPGENQNEQMKYFIKSIGTPPPSFTLKGQRTDHFFDPQGKPLTQLLNTKSIQHFQLPLSTKINDQTFFDFIQGFLKWNPKQRFTPLQALNHRWIRQGLPPQITKAFPFERNQNRESRSKSQKSRMKSQQKHYPQEKSPQQERCNTSNIRIKKSSKQLRQKSRQLKNIKD